MQEIHALIPHKERPKGRKLGRHIHFDERSREHDVKELLTTAALATKQWPRSAPILDQGNLGSCTGNGTAGALGTTPNDHDGVGDKIPITEKLAVAIYEKATLIDTIYGAYPPNDTGSTVLAAMKAAKAMRLIAGYKWSFTFDHALTTLSQLGPLVIGVSWYAGFDKPNAKGLVKLGGKLEGGHCFVVDGIDVENKLVHATNSWGKSWALKGHFSFSWADFEKLLKDSGEACLILPPSKPAPVVA